MSTYKVIQDIEAEDKILGPLTLRQFIYGLISLFFLYICFICATKGAAFLLVLFLPPAIFTGFFAMPFGKDQPTEVWALAKIRYYFKPRKRIWDQSGIKELVTITVPKKIEQVLTNGLSQNEVESRLKALANTIDSRGWAVKNVNVNLYSQPGSLAAAGSDRLIDLSSLPQEVPNYDVQPSDDMLDETNNPVAHQFDTMIMASTQNHRQQLMNEMNAAGHNIKPAAVAPTTTPPNDYWFMNQPTEPPNLPANKTVFDNSQVVQPGSDNAGVAAGIATADEAALVEHFKEQQSTHQTYNSHLRTIQPLGTPPPAPEPPVLAPPTDGVIAPAPMTAPPDPAILSLANNNDLNVATLAREASKAKNSGGLSDDEVVISLR